MEEKDEHMIREICRKAYSIMVDNCGGHHDPATYGWESHDDLHYIVCELPSSTKIDSDRICSLIMGEMEDMAPYVYDSYNEEGVVEFGANTFNINIIKNSKGVECIELELVNPREI